MITECSLSEEKRDNILKSFEKIVVLLSLVLGGVQNGGIFVLFAQVVQCLVDERRLEVAVFAAVFVVLASEGAVHFFNWALRSHLSRVGEWLADDGGDLFGVCLCFDILDLALF